MEQQSNIRPNWDEIYMTLALIYSSRSPDPSTRHGCVIVSSDNRPIAFGYNGFPKGSKDNSLYPLTRPEKYAFISHSEIGALSNRTLNTEGCTAYVTGKPCSKCMVSMVQGGIKKIVYGNIGSHCVAEEDWNATLLIAENCGISLAKYDGCNPVDIFNKVGEYLEIKGWD